ncbi:MAG TPA: lipid-A-disaccharide synthase, partial [Candidatus Omnitrophota bacterium]|nr:lipid-A-disaccharide synthase [Candidatus Omnitrophota bacterium]
RRQTSPRSCPFNHSKNMEKSTHIMIVAGEASGDLHGFRLVEALKELRPGITFSGLGGPRMERAGVEIYADLTRLAVVGFWEVLKHFQHFKRVFQTILNKIKETRPAAVILIDYPGFNLRLAREIKRAGIPTKVIYYISPQVWAWKENRIKLIRKVCDQMLVILPFEKEFYAQRGMTVEFIGHPILDSLKTTQSEPDFLCLIGFSSQYATIGLLPGSREKEIEKILPVMLEAAKILYAQNNQLQFLLMKAQTIRLSHLEEISNRYTLPLRVIGDQTYNGINASDVCMVTSGTATLETAILEKPMVVVYKTSFLTWVLAKFLVKISWIGLVNVVAGKKIVPECIQFNATPQKIAREITSIYTNEKKIAEIKSELQKVKESLGAPGASRRAAEAVVRILS